MRACTIANTLFGLTFATLATVAACGGGSVTSLPSEPSDSASSKHDSAPPSAPPAASEKRADKAPETVADCKALASEITNEPPSGGTVMNNATPPDGGPPSDRFNPMVDLIKSKRDSFRCCFDLWAKSKSGAQGKLIVKFELNPEGKLQKVEVDDKNSTLHVPEVNACVVDVSKSLHYPASPSGKDTKFTYPFDFKARH